MASAIISKLENYTRLSRRDKASLERMCGDRVRTYERGEDILREDEHISHINIVIDGWAWRYRHLEDGRRQVTSLFLPGDLCDLYVFVLKQMDHFLGAVTRVEVAQVSRALFDDVTLKSPRVLQALLWDTLVAQSIQREWTVNLGQRTAEERIAHLMCETFVRLRSAGRTRNGSCEWPLTQAQVADATGLSTVHVNRTIRDLRGSNLIVLEGRVLTIPDLEALKAAALFDPNYLHLEHEGQHLDANEP